MQVMPTSLRVLNGGESVIEIYTMHLLRINFQFKTVKRWKRFPSRILFLPKFQIHLSSFNEKTEQ